MIRKILQKNKHSLKKQSGFSVVEIILAITIFTIMSSGAVILMINILTSSNNNILYNQAIILSSEGLEFVHYLAETDFEVLFSLLQDGPFEGRISFSENDNENPAEWDLVSSDGPVDKEEIVFQYEDNTTMRFFRKISINNLSGETEQEAQLLVQSVVSWDDNNHEVSLHKVLRNISWQE